MISDDVKERIYSCISKPTSVWDGIKRIINVEKYTWYLNEILKVKKIKCIDTIKSKWDSFQPLDKKLAYMCSKEFDDDLKSVLVKYALVCSKNNYKLYNLGSNIQTWRGTAKKPPSTYMERENALMFAAVAGFNVEETRSLLFNCLKQDKQNDFNPRVIDEMLYLYSIQHSPIGIHQSVRDNRIDGSLVEVLHNTRVKYLTMLLGEEYVDYYDGFVCQFEGKKENTNNDYKNNEFIQFLSIHQINVNITDASQINSIAFLLSLYISVANGSINLKSINAESKVKLAKLKQKRKKEETNKETESTDEVDNKYPIILPKTSIEQYKYILINTINADANQGYVPNDNDVQNKYLHIYPEDIRNINIKTYLITIKKIIQLLEATFTILQNNKDGEKQLKINRAMHKNFENMQKCLENINEKEYIELYELLYQFSFIELLEIDNEIVNDYIERYIIEQLVRPFCDGKKNIKKHLDSNVDDSDDLSTKIELIRSCGIFIMRSLKIVLRDFRAIYFKANNDLLSVYLRANSLLEYTFFNSDGMGELLFEYYEGKSSKEDVKRINYNGQNIEIRYDGDIFTYTLELIQQRIDGTTECKEITQFADYLISDLHLYEYLDPRMESIGVQKYLEQIEEEPIKLRMPEYFYSSKRFHKQNDLKNIKFTRNDLLKIAYWCFINDDEYYDEQGNAIRPINKYKSKFLSIFNQKVAPIACCSMIHTRRKLDSFLLLSLEQINPRKFIDMAIETIPELENIF